jgi:hypothetical protein
MKFESIYEIIEQLKSCNYQCEAGPLENNVAFIDLERHAKLQGCHNWHVKMSACGECVWCERNG